uniref:Uncharacterized protein n=1 Tax=Ixodes ricinus TaxID=34613 RepID=A0A6B0TZ75_IXORI
MKAQASTKALDPSLALLTLCHTHLRKASLAQAEIEGMWRSDCRLHTLRMPNEQAIAFWGLQVYGLQAPIQELKARCKDCLLKILKL